MAHLSREELLEKVKNITQWFHCFNKCRSVIFPFRHGSVSSQWSKWVDYLLKLPWLIVIMKQVGGNNLFHNTWDLNYTSSRAKNHYQTKFRCSAIFFILLVDFCYFKRIETWQMHFSLTQNITWTLHLHLSRQCTNDTRFTENDLSNTLLLINIFKFRVPFEPIDVT